VEAKARQNASEARVKREPHRKGNQTMTTERYFRHPMDVPPNFSGVALFPDDTKHWYVNGLLHREDGPAIEQPNGKFRWRLRGRPQSEADWKKLLLLMEDERHLLSIYDYCVDLGKSRMSIQQEIALFRLKQTVYRQRSKLYEYLSVVSVQGVDVEQLRQQNLSALEEMIAKLAAA
jgi:hypothetical protein